MLTKLRTLRRMLRVFRWGRARYSRFTLGSNQTIVSHYNLILIIQSLLLIETHNHFGLYFTM